MRQAHAIRIEADDESGTRTRCTLKLCALGHALASLGEKVLAETTPHGPKALLAAIQATDNAYQFQDGSKALGRMSHLLGDDDLDTAVRSIVDRLTATSSPVEKNRLGRALETFGHRLPEHHARKAMELLVETLTAGGDEWKAVAPTLHALGHYLSERQIIEISDVIVEEIKLQAADNPSRILALAELGTRLSIDRKKDIISILTNAGLTTKNTLKFRKICKSLSYYKTNKLDNKMYETLVDQIKYPCTINEFQSLLETLALFGDTLSSEAANRIVQLAVERMTRPENYDKCPSIAKNLHLLTTANTTSFAIEFLKSPLAVGSVRADILKYISHIVGHDFSDIAPFLVWTRTAAATPFLGNVDLEAPWK